jgi:D-alanine-D-alanine ligase
MGGLSSEREVSLNTGRPVLAALVSRGHDAVGIDWAAGTHLPTLLAEAKVNVVWNALHGTFGEDGCVQGLLECLQIPYTGSGVLASALAMDKVLSKRILDQTGVPTPRWALVPQRPDGVDTLDFPTPCVVKPSREGSSVGVSIVRDRADLPGAVALARGHRGVVLVEEYVKGPEISVGVLDDEVIGTVQIQPAKEFYDYEAKYLRDDTIYTVPAPLAPEVDAQVRAHALSAHKLFGCAGYSRVDLLVGPGGKPQVLEVNTLPGMTDHSLIPKIARHAGIDYAELVVRILRTAALRA